MNRQYNKGYTRLGYKEKRVLSVRVYKFIISSIYIRPRKDRCGIISCIMSVYIGSLGPDGSILIEVTLISYTYC